MHWSSQTGTTPEKFGVLGVQWIWGGGRGTSQVAVMDVICTSGPRLIPSNFRCLTKVPKLGAWSIQCPLTAPGEKAGVGDQGVAGAALLLPTAEGATGLCLQFWELPQPHLGRTSMTLGAGNPSEPGIAAPSLPQHFRPAGPYHRNNISFFNRDLSSHNRCLNVSKVDQMEFQ